MRNPSVEMPSDQETIYRAVAALWGSSQKGEKANNFRGLLLRNTSQEISNWVLDQTSAELFDTLSLEFKRHTDAGIQVIPIGSSPYPQLLQHQPDAPLLLFAKADRPQIMDRPMIAIVGARKATQSAENAAFDLARYLALRGAVIVSGLAYGIDAAAHRGALASNREGATLAVVAHGLDRLYPASHRDLAELIIKRGGAIISQFPCGVRALPHHFLIRNQVIAAMSFGTIVIQAAERSGSLATARAALDAGREVLTLPGDFGDERFRGSNRLLRDGAHLISELRDLEVVFPWLEPIENKPEIIQSPIDSDQEVIVEYLKKNGATEIELFPPELGGVGVVSAKLVELELNGVVYREAANTYALKQRFE